MKMTSDDTYDRAIKILNRMEECEEECMEIVEEGTGVLYNLDPAHFSCEECGAPLDRIAQFDGDVKFIITNTDYGALKSVGEIKGWKHHEYKCPRCFDCWFNYPLDTLIAMCAFNDLYMI